MSSDISSAGSYIKADAIENKIRQVRSENHPAENQSLADRLGVQPPESSGQSGAGHYSHSRVPTAVCGRAGYRSSGFFLCQVRHCGETRQRFLREVRSGTEKELNTKPRQKRPQQCGLFAQPCSNVIQRYKIKTKNLYNEKSSTPATVLRIFLFIVIKKKLFC